MVVVMGCALQQLFSMIQLTCSLILIHWELEFCGFKSQSGWSADKLLMGEIGTFIYATLGRSLKLHLRLKVL